MEEGVGVLAPPGTPARWNLVQFGFLCCYTMGLGAVGSFPYYVYRHTGLYLVAYYLLLALIAVPVTFIQLKLGGVYKRGIVGLCSHFVPALKGAAVALLFVSLLWSVLNSITVSYSVYYMWAALKQPYGWATFSNTSQRVHSSYIFFAKTPAQDYFYNVFLQRSASLENPGDVPWHLGVCLCVVWLLTYIWVCRGPSWFGKVIYGSAPVALLSLFALIIYSHVAVPTAFLSLPSLFSDRRHLVNKGHTNGHGHSGSILAELTSPLTWLRALEQHVYCVGLWAGILPSIGRHLGNKKPASNLTWLLVLLVHSMLPHLVTIAMAPFIHALAVHKGVSFDDVITSGHSLLFVVLPEAFAALSVNPFWVYLFYLCIAMFLLHQQALYVLVIGENMMSAFPQCILLVFRRIEFFFASLCALAFFLGLPHITQGGSYLLQLVHAYLYSAFFVPIMLCIPSLFIAYMRVDRHNVPIERICLCIWFAVASVGAAVLLVYNTFMLQPPSNTDSDWPRWMNILGWLIAVGPITVCVMAGYAHALYSSSDTGIQRLVSVFQSLSDELDIPDSPDSDVHMNGGIPGHRQNKVKRPKVNQNGAAPQLMKQLKVAVASPQLQRNGHRHAL